MKGSAWGSGGALLASCSAASRALLRSSATWRLRLAAPSISSAMRCASATLIPALALSRRVVYRFSSHVLCTCSRTTHAHARVGHLMHTARRAKPSPPA